MEAVINNVDVNNIEGTGVAEIATPELTKEDLAKEFVKLYGICFKYAKDMLVGATLKTRFETVEKSLRKVRKKNEDKLEMLSKKIEETKAKYNTAAKEFERMSLEELNPNKYDEIVAPLEKELTNLVSINENTIKYLQGVKNLCTSMFARDKKMIPALCHSYSLFLAIKIVEDYIKNDYKLDLQSDNKEEEENIRQVLDTIFKSKALKGDLTPESSVEDIVDYLSDITEHQVEKLATTNRQRKDEAFKILDNICKTCDIIVPEPEIVRGVTDAERELIYKTNQIKAIQSLLANKNKSANITKETKDSIVNAVRLSSLYLNGMTTIMDENFIEQLPFKKDSMMGVYHTITKMSANLHKKLEGKIDKFDLDIVLAWVFLSTTLVDQIPRAILMM